MISQSNGKTIEMCLVSSLINKPSLMPQKIESFWFTDSDYQKIITSLKEGYSEIPDLARHTGIDIKDLLELAEVIKIPTKVSVKGYTKLLLEAYKNREFSKTREDAPDNEVIDRLERIKGLSLGDDADPYEDFLNNVDSIASGKPDERIVSTEFSNIDMGIGGFRKSEFVVIGGRPGAGKTAFALNMAYNMASKGKKVVFFSLEMSTTEFIDRICKSVLGITSYTADNCQQVFAFVRKLKDMPLVINDRGGTTIEDITGILKHTPCDCCIVDHLSILKSNRHFSTRYEELSDITRRLKITAKDMNIPVVALCQLNRQLETREIKAPTLADLRDSGTIEQDADIIGFIYRPEYHLLQAKPDGGEKLEKWQEAYHKCKGKAQFIVAKNRRGICDRYEFRFNGATFKFEEVI